MYLITGGSGFIGGHFHRFIPHEKIINLDLVEPLFENRSHFLKGDVRQKSDVQKAIKDKPVDTIISLAAKHHDFGISQEEYFDTNEKGTSVICHVASEVGIKKIIFFSSVAVYGIREKASSETMEPRPDAPYGMSKLAGEKVLEKWVQEDPSRMALAIRPALVFGPNNMANMRNLIRQIDSGLYFHLGKGNNIKSIAYVENLIHATLFLSERMKPGLGIYNYADEPQLSTREIGNVIASKLDKKIRITVPKSLAILMGIPFDIIIKLTGKNLPISSARIEKLGTQTFHSAQKILKEGFRPTHTTVDGIRKMVDWYKDEKNHKATVS